MIDMLACVQTDDFQIEALRRISLALLALAFGVYVLMRLWGRRRFGDASPVIIENCHKGYAWSDIDKAYLAAGPEKLAVYRSRQLPFDRVFALIYGVAATVTGVWAYADGCRGLGERWFALSLIAIGLLAMIFDWLEGSALKRVTLAWERANAGGDDELHASLALAASRRTVTKFWLFLVAALQAVWFHLTAVAPGWELTLALLCGMTAGVFLGKPNPDLKGPPQPAPAKPAADPPAGAPAPAA